MLFRLKDPTSCPPDRAHDTDAGMDLFAQEDIFIPEKEVRMVGLGVSVAIPKGHFGMLALRSSMGKKGFTLPNGVGIIDSDYRGELKLLVTHITGELFIYKGEKIAQLIIIPFVSPVLEQYEGGNEAWEQSTARGTNGFGSTGT